jgi:hypothetical protein
MSKNDDYKSARYGRDFANRERESYFGLHQRQKGAVAAYDDRADYVEVGSMSFKSIPRLRMYVSLASPELGPFVDDAKHKAKQAYLSGKRHWSADYIIDVAKIAISLGGRTCHIRITWNLGFSFEFITSGNPVSLQSVTQGSQTFYSYKAVGVAASIRYQDGKLDVKPRITKQKRSVDSEISIIDRQFQIQLVNEPVVYPQEKRSFLSYRYRRALMETFAPGHGWTGVPTQNTYTRHDTFTAEANPGPLVTYSSRDRFFDVPFEAHNARDTDTSLAYIRGTADWPRANGLQKVKSQWGEREFAVYVTAFNQFIVFPTAAIGPLNITDSTLQNVDEAYVQRFAPTMPSWAWKPSVKAETYYNTDPDISHWLKDEPEWDWKFNHLSTKAVAVAFERVQMENDQTYIDTDINTDQAWTQTKFDTIIAADCGILSLAQMADPEAYKSDEKFFMAPGLVEVTVEITINGPGLEDYTATVVATELRKPSTNTTNVRWPMIAGYVWYDNTVAKKGDLIAVCLEYWLRPKGTYGEDTEREWFLSVRNVTTNAELLCYRSMRMLAADLTTLSFALMPIVYKQERRQCVQRNSQPGGGGMGVTSPYDVLFSIAQIAVVIVHSGKWKDTLWPETMAVEDRTEVQNLINLNARLYMDDLIANQGSDPWEMMALNSERDGWSSAGIQNYRAWWMNERHYWYNEFFVFQDPDVWFYGSSYPTEGYVQYKVASPAPTLNAAGTAARKACSAEGGSHEHLMFCTNPKWGWHWYMAYTRVAFWLHNFNTFYTHPNGSWAFYESAMLYDRNGVPGAYNVPAVYGDTSYNIVLDGFEYKYETYEAYDVAKIEHCIFDKIHFELRTFKQVMGKKDTSFRELYNKAVDKGKAALTLEAGIDELPLTTLKATFEKQQVTTDRGHYVLELKATWPSTASWWFQDQSFMGMAYGDEFPYYAGFAGNLLGLNLMTYWRTTDAIINGVTGIPGLPDMTKPETYGHRFANPIIIDDR